MRILAVWSCKQCILQFFVLCLGSTYYILCRLVDLLIFHHQCHQMSFPLFLRLKVNLYLRYLFCDKAFCWSFTVIRVVLLSFFWLLYVAAWRLKNESVISMSTLSINSSNIVLLMKLSPLSVATYSRNLREFTVFWSAADRNFTFTLTNSVGSISFMICSIEMSLCSSFFATTTVFGLIVGKLVNQNSVSLFLIMLVITQFVDSLLNFCNFLCLPGEKQTPRTAVVLVWNVISKIKVTFRNISFRFFYLHYLSSVK